MIHPVATPNGDYVGWSQPNSDQRYVQLVGVLNEKWTDE